MVVVLVAQSEIIELHSAVVFPTLLPSAIQITDLTSQPVPWPQVYKANHLVMQTASTNIIESIGRSQELCELQHRGTVIG